MRSLCLLGWRVHAHSAKQLTSELAIRPIQALDKPINRLEIKSTDLMAPLTTEPEMLLTPMMVVVTST